MNVERSLFEAVRGKRLPITRRVPDVPGIVRTGQISREADGGPDMTANNDTDAGGPSR
ncbi:hypothetical protein FHX52_2228 [Humibacillus xanthopallidus]|uniref:Uncharacterized protein n=1 Tax=Humibacillus xanthopallidus TaxID=412689 RepID=A0A543PYA2_9MICO|nr:hypothetical protein [Humibacillus xanthopallidus]TQN49067.1 hypothetical protein FHX52_2228 [Humibacillus xanthopallidus]